jgi:hypothetical protein
MSEQIVQVADASPSTKNMRTIQQTAGGNTVQSEVVVLATGAPNGGDTYDARQIRTLTSADIVTAILQSAVFKANNSVPTNTELSMEVKLASLGGTLLGSTLPISGSVTASGTVTANQGTANTVANAWPIKVTDGTNTVSLNTGGFFGPEIPVFIDTTISGAIPVVLSPNNAVAFSVINQSSNISAVGGTAPLTGIANQCGSAYFTGTWTGSVIFEVTFDNGASQWFPIYARNVATGQWVTSITGTFSNPMLFQFFLPAGNGYRARATSWTSGTASINMVSSPFFDNTPTFAGAFGQSVPFNGALMAASDGVNLQPLSVDGSGRLKVSQVSDAKQIAKSTWGPGWGNFTGW